LLPTGVQGRRVDAVPAPGRRRVDAEAFGVAFVDLLVPEPAAFDGRRWVGALRR
jgi:hypothetical protein